MLNALHGYPTWSSQQPCKVAVILLAEETETERLPEAEGISQSYTRELGFECGLFDYRLLP